jgi:DNA repair and recombination protein RAD54B
VLTKADIRFSRATCCLNNPMNAPLNSAANPTSRSGPAPKPFKAPTANGRGTTPLATRITPLNAPLHRPFTPVTPRVGPSSAGPSTPSAAFATAADNAPPQSAKSFYGQPAKPAKKIFIGDKNNKEREAWGGALHDPKAPGALVLPRPSESEAKRMWVAVRQTPPMLT